MVRLNINDENGYTIVEIMISLTIVSIVLGLVSTIFVFLNSQLINWQTNLQFYNDFQVVQGKVYKDILRADDFIRTDTSLVVYDIDLQENIYSWPEGILVINRREVVNSEVDTLLVTMQETQDDNDTIYWSIRLKKEDKVFNQDYILSARKPIRWSPLGSSQNGED